MSDHVDLRNELDELRKELELVRTLADSQAQELAKYRDFWGEAWPRGLERLDTMAGLAKRSIYGTGLVAVVGIAGGYCLLNRAKRLVEAQAEAVKETRLAAQAPVMLNRLDRLWAPDALTAQELLYNTYATDASNIAASFNTKSDVDRACERVIRELGELGILLHQHSINEEFLKARVGMIAARMAIILKDYIDERERQRGGSHLEFKFVTKLGLDHWLEAEQRRGVPPGDRTLKIWNRVEIPNDVVIGRLNALTEELRNARWLERP